ncbi:MAG: FAD-dependent oxidoreductase [Verrucomicrobia bacterium]|nr:FAD-dependent oxidoreductase [Verrucomicrobiota bacterium]
MNRLQSIQDLPPLRESIQQALAARARSGPVIYVGMGTCGIAAGARETLQAIEQEIAKHHIPAQIVSVGCIGMCAKEPLVDIQLNGGSHVLYANIQPEMVARLIGEHVINQQPVREWLICRMADGDVPDDEPQAIQNLPQFRDLPFTGKQVRIALGNCGLIDPTRIEDYIARDGYRGLGRVLGSWSPEEVIKEIKESGLRGRGGGGFSTGTKWELCRKAPGDTKYVICNADEGDPGAFMDRSILESDPHAVLEGMAIAGYAMGAREGIIYCREEYPLAIDRLEAAIEQACELGLLGDGILGTNFGFDITLKGGAGAFVCGEETALIASIEGRRGEPRPRPPFPAVSGLWGKPSNINNVKSYAMSPRIVLRGAAWFKNIGSAKSPGTAIFALTGKVNNTGLIEVPMGIPLGDIIFDVGGGIPEGRTFKAVQTGGPLGGCLPASSLNTPVDFDSLQEAGAVMGSGGMIVVDDDTCMVELAKYFLTFATAESCGKCVPCRIGGQRLLEILTRITEGGGTRQDLATIRELSAHMTSSSLCGLGQRTAGPVMSVLRFFEDEVLAHIDNQICPAGQCKKLVRAKCINTCPAGVDTPAYLALIAQGRYAEGLAIHRERNPFPIICGRACPAFCETKCRRAELDEPIAIRLTKRFMAEHESEAPWTPEPLGSPEQRRVASGKKVAVIGAGPAGLTAAVRLAQLGYGVTVFEKLPMPGGMMSWAIPEYRMPRQPLFLEIDYIKRAGVEIRCNQALGKDFTLEELLGVHGFTSVVLAIGAHRSRQMGIPGEEKSGVINGIDFLREVARESCERAFDNQSTADIPEMRGKRVGIVGGGDVAIDAARVALRLGAKEVHVMYRRTGDDMPATHLPEEIEGALHEGVRFHTLVNPVEVLGNGSVTGVRLVRQRLADFDDTARRKPVAMEAESFTLPLDFLIPAIGQMPDLSWMQHDQINVTRSRTFVVNEAFVTSRPGVFAAGDAVSGPATIVQAIAQGNLVAVAVDEWLRTGQTPKPRFVTPRHDIASMHNLDDFATAHRPATPKLDLAQREGNFNEVELGLGEAAAQAEAKRCLRCDLEWLERIGMPRPTAAAAEFAAASKEKP